MASQPHNPIAAPKCSGIVLWDPRAAGFNVFPGCQSDLHSNFPFAVFLLEKDKLQQGEGNKS